MKFINNVIFSVKKHSPEILVFLGIGGMLTGTVMACKATRKLDPVIEKHKKNALKARNGENKAIVKVYLNTGKELMKLYAVPAAVMGLSVASILTGHNTLRKRNIALAATCLSLDRGFKTYRGRVIDKYGKEVDTELLTGERAEKIELVETDENGKEKTVKKTVLISDPDVSSPYVRYFCPSQSLASEGNLDFDTFFIKQTENLANLKFKAQEEMYLNDVLDQLGFKKSVAGQVVGWVYDKDRDDHGDNYIDFGCFKTDENGNRTLDPKAVVYRKNSPAPGDYERMIRLEFNVDGLIEEHALKLGLIDE